jgi:hypothetical protein
LSTSVSRVFFLSWCVYIMEADSSSRLKCGGTKRKRTLFTGIPSSDEEAEWEAEREWGRRNGRKRARIAPHGEGQLQQQTSAAAPSTRTESRPPSSSTFPPLSLHPDKVPSSNPLSNPLSPKSSTANSQTRNALYSPSPSSPVWPAASTTSFRSSATQLPPVSALSLVRGGLRSISPSPVPQQHIGNNKNNNNQNSNNGNKKHKKYSNKNNKNDINDDDISDSSNEDDNRNDDNRTKKIKVTTSTVQTRSSKRTSAAAAVAGPARAPTPTTTSTWYFEDDSGCRVPLTDKAATDALETAFRTRDPAISFHLECKEYTAFLFGRDGTQLDPMYQVRRDSATKTSRLVPFPSQQFD